MVVEQTQGYGISLNLTKPNHFRHALWYYETFSANSGFDSELIMRMHMKV